MEPYLYDEMFRLEERHWWFAAKHQIILTLLDRIVPSDPTARIADLGCGCGRMLELLHERYSAIGVDASPQALEFCRRRNVSIELGHLPDQLPLPQQSFDAVLMLDVLEHLDDDLASARAAAALLKPQGYLLVTVPAYAWLYGPHDAAHHHRRRYSKRELARTLTAAGLRIELLSYYNTFLFPLALLQRLGQRLSGSTSQVATKTPSAPINSLFRKVFAVERHLIGRLPLPAGLSLVAIAKLQTQSSTTSPGTNPTR